MMKGTIILIIALSITLTLQKRPTILPIQTTDGDAPNPVNPKYNYPEINLVNTKEAGIPFAGQMYTGYLKVNQSSESRMFYVLYAAGGSNNSSANLNRSAPLILWLQGGPGSADGGNYAEVGPFNVLANKQGQPIPTPNQITWNDEYHMLFVDAPVGVGFSVAAEDLPNTAMGYAAHLHNFLVRFFQIYPSLKKQEFYIFGQSYSGHYISALTTVILQNYSSNGIN